MGNSQSRPVCVCDARKSAWKKRKMAEQCGPFDRDISRIGNVAFFKKKEKVLYCVLFAYRLRKADWIWFFSQFLSFYLYSYIEVRNTCASGEIAMAE